MNIKNKTAYIIFRCCSLIFICLMLCSFNSYSQNDTVSYSHRDTLQSFKKPVFKSPQEFRKIYKTNFMPILWGPVPYSAEYRLLYETAVSHTQSFQIGVSYLGKSP